MIWLADECIRFYREPSGPILKTVDDPSTHHLPEEETEEEDYILCRQCRQIISTPAERIVVQGAHRHTFANPQGIIFHIGCFRSVRGCGFIGPLTAEFTWFRGFRWRVALCNACLTHLGWMFSSSSNERFSGLILDRLIEP